MKLMMHRIISRAGLAAAFAAVLSAVVVCNAAQTDIKPNCWIEGDDSSGVSYYMDETGFIKIQFAENPPSAYVPPSRLAGNIEAGVGVSSGAFIGDYVAAGVTGLQFAISGDGHIPSGAMVILHSASGRDWFYKNVNISTSPSVWTVNSVGFTVESGWTRTDPPGVDKEANFLEDIRNVMSIGIAVAPGGREAQYYIIDNFVLYGEGGVLTSPADLSPLEKALLDKFNVKSMDKLTDSQKAQDTDKDGMTDANEILSEHDVQYANSIFKTDFEEPENAPGIVLKWACVGGHKYTVLRTKNIMDPFSELPNNKGKEMIAQETGFMKYIDDEASEDGPYFYRIIKK